MLPVVATVLAQPASSPARLLVVSGGGARGAWGVGIANYLDSTGKRYAHVVGTSTGSLMAPLILLRKFEQLNQAYTTTTQDKIFNLNPFKKDGGIRILNALCRFNKPSLGKTDNLKTLIRTFVTPDDYTTIRSHEPTLDFTVSLVNLRTLAPAYQSASANADYEQMVNWIWASANEPVFMSPYIRPDANGNEDYWVDGGVRNPVPIRQGLQIALQNGYSDVDVVVNSPLLAEEPAATWPDRRPSLFKSLSRTLDAYGSGTREMNLTIGRLLARLANLQPEPQPATTSAATTSAVSTGAVSTSAATTSDEPVLTLTFYFMPDDLYRLIPNELMFDPVLMTTLLNAGKQGRYVTQPTEVDVARRLEAITRRAEGTFSFALSRAVVRQLIDELNN